LESLRQESGQRWAGLLIFDVEKGRLQQRIEGSKPVHGVAWAGKTLAAMSTDRCLRVYEQGKKGFYIKHCIKEAESHKLFQDEASSSAYFRRLAFSPDSKILIASAGLANGLPAVHLFFHDSSNLPVLSFPVNITQNATALAVRFCPVLFKSTKTGLFSGTGTRLVWAVACKDAVIVYSSDEDRPIAAVTNPHYSSISDIAWSGEMGLAVSSIDGFVSFVAFAKGELGEVVEIGEKDEEAESEGMIENNKENEENGGEQVNVVVGGKKRIVPQIIGNVG
jgi:WD40 repeat protein